MIIERTWWERGERHEAVRYGITSLPPEIADARRLLALVRGHWQIENGLLLRIDRERDHREVS